MSAALGLPLKPRQQEAFDAVFKRLNDGIDKILLNLPTGVGKTVIGCHIAAQFDRVLFLCHRHELVEQSAKTMAAVDPNRTQGRIEQGNHELGQFTIAMLPTVYRRLNKMNPDSFDCVILDESHHATSKTFREVLDYFQPKLRLGLTATPERLDGAALSNLFDEISYSMSLRDAVDEGYLVPPSAHQCLTSISLEGVHTRAGDFAEDELAVLVDDPIRNNFIAEKYQQHCPGRRAIAFCVNIAHAVHLAEAFNAVGIKAEWVSGADVERADKLKRFAAGEFSVLTNCQILTEGYDDKSVDAILLCRPTKSKSLFAQMVGRGLRLNEGKADCKVLDFVDNAGKHSLVTAWRFFGHKNQPRDEYPQGIAPAVVPRHSKVKAVDLERQIDLLQPPEIDAFNYGSSQWHHEPATDKQLQFLAKLGYDVINNDYSKGQASGIIGSQPASSNQLRLLAGYGYNIDTHWTRNQASKALDDSKRKWLSTIERIESAGFKLSAAGSKLDVAPIEKMDLIQREWITRNKKPLLFALKSE